MVAHHVGCVFQNECVVNTMELAQYNVPISLLVPSPRGRSKGSGANGTAERVFHVVGAARGDARARAGATVG